MEDLTDTVDLPAVMTVIKRFAQIQKNATFLRAQKPFTEIDP